MKRGRGCAAIAATLILAGCATQATKPASPPTATGDASWHVKDSADTAHYQLAMGSVSSGAAPIERVTPVYPPDQLAACPPPLDVEALLIVDKAGKVDEVRVAEEQHADTSQREFISAVRKAATQWTFMPLQISRWAADADGNSHEVDRDMLPFSQTYVFHFECHAGKAAVTADGKTPL
jgi:hypothetical protein